jgi:hypothetical protein
MNKVAGRTNAALEDQVPAPHETIFDSAVGNASILCVHLLVRKVPTLQHSGKRLSQIKGCTAYLPR